MKIEDLPTNSEWTTSDWAQTFPATEGGPFGTSGDYSGTFAAGDLSSTRIEDVTPDRLAEVIDFYGAAPGGELEFCAVARLTDGSYACSEAWADFTGWGCEANAYWKVGPTYESVLAELSKENRNKIGVA